VLFNQDKNAHQPLKRKHFRQKNFSGDLNSRLLFLPFNALIHYRFIVDNYKREYSLFVYSLIMQNIPAAHCSNAFHLLQQHGIFLRCCEIAIVQHIDIAKKIRLVITFFFFGLKRKF